MYQRMPLTFDRGHRRRGAPSPIYWNGRGLAVPDRASIGGCRWTALDGLAALGRLDAAGVGLSAVAGSTMRMRCRGEGSTISGTSQMSASDKRYVVQTANSVVERCLLMATDPGDLVLDPTCGGATTAYSAERWGRRWITIDTSPVATAIARQRIATATFPYYTLRDSPEGARAEAELSGRDGTEAPADGYGNDPAAGFVYQRVPYVSAATLAYDEDPPATMLVDQPHATRGVVRATSPFTVESETPWSYLPFEECRRRCRPRSPRACAGNARGRRRLRGNRAHAHLRVADPRRPAGQ